MYFFLLNRLVFSNSVYTLLILLLTAICILYCTSNPKHNHPVTPAWRQDGHKQIKSTSVPLTALQQHIIFWDRDCDNVIYPHNVYTGFREIGFSIPFSLASLLIPVFFSYPTRLAHSYIPDPLFRIYVSSIHKAKHGSDTSIYDIEGNFRVQFFEDMFIEYDSAKTGSLGASDLLRMVGRNRVAADPAGWSFAAMEWGTTWLLLQREGRVWKEDLRECYNGTLFWRLKEERESGVEPQMGYGWREFCLDGSTWTRDWWAETTVMLLRSLMERVLKLANK